MQKIIKEAVSLASREEQRMDCRNEDNVSFIRLKTRDSCHALRLKKRSLAVNVRRQRLEEVVKKLKAPTTEEFTQLCLHLKKHKDLYALQKLRHALSSSEDNITVFLNCQGALYSLVTCLTGQDGALQREAACTLVNLALGNEKHCVEVCKQVGVYLVLHLANSNPDLQDPCAWCIGNLCGGNAEVCKLLGSQGMEEVLVKALTSHAPHVIQSAAYALTQYLATLQERIRPVSGAPLVRHLVDALSMTGGLPEVGWCLFMLSTDQEVCRLLLDQGIIGSAFNILEKLVNEQNLSVAAVTPIMRVLMNCAASVHGTAVEICYRNEQFVQVTRALLYSSTPHLQTETVHFLANVLNAASAESLTGQCVVEDLSLRPRLEPALRRALAAHFTLHQPEPQVSFSGVLR
ncbi:hypothetical protein O3P69_007315 [Scylla paramamosain]|uniref:Uncharacterized protein n=1 Tax=Scylla paramamosain TaxID=85552 RepID=A0AAW0V568_SCYPA